VIDELIISLTEAIEGDSVIVTHEMDSAFRIANAHGDALSGQGHCRRCPEIFKNSDDPVVQQFLSGSTEGPILEGKQRCSCDEMRS
jgi:phospholipid/cholesterol/gamma-HCH transport system ATP-binding protein